MGEMGKIAIPKCWFTPLERTYLKITCEYYLQYPETWTRFGIGDQKWESEIKVCHEFENIFEKYKNLIAILIFFKILFKPTHA